MWPDLARFKMNSCALKCPKTGRVSYSWRFSVKEMDWSNSPFKARETKTEGKKEGKKEEASLSLSQWTENLVRQIFVLIRRRPNFVTPMG